MRRFNGFPKGHLGLFLKECKWSFNSSDPSLQLQQLKQWVSVKSEMVIWVSPNIFVYS